MNTAVRTIEYLPNDMYIIKGSDQPKRLSKFGIWHRDNYEKGMIVLERKAVSQ